MLDRFDGTEIAIIGMAGRFPGARNIHEFWHNLRDGVESISFPTDQEIAELGVDPAVRNHPNFVKAAAIMADPDKFDAAFFGFRPREAELMDPQHRIFLECAWEALEHAGYDTARYPKTIGVYAGTQISTYLLFNIASYQAGKSRNSLDDVRISMANSGDFLTTRVSYKLDLKGPSHVVQSACSTSLVAVHLACQSLLYGECDMALAGGVSINVNSRAGYFYLEEGIVSPDGHCRAFDAKAQGTLFGTGVGLVVLKRLDAALEDGDYIHAVIKGSAINNDGALKVGFTAPSVEGQARVIAEALANADVSAETISYIEAHGTGTALGDPIEIQALTKAFRTHTSNNGFCAIGAVKTNVGHLDTAAGVTGLIKTVLALKHRQIPPSLHFEQPNPQIPFAETPFFVNNKLTEWQPRFPIRRAGVSAFGMGGTNAHLIVEEAPPIEAGGRSRPWQVITLSAKTGTALETTTTNLVEFLKQQPELNLADLAYTYQVGRRVFEHRRTVVCRDLQDAIQALEKRDAQRITTRLQGPDERPITFMFSGGGAEYVRMGLGLYQSEPTFQKHLAECAERLRSHLGYDIRDWLYPTDDRVEEASQRLKRPSTGLPALFATEYALARLWMSWGVQPQALIGHSMGEYVAACLADVFSLDNALALTALRGRLFEQLPAGAMLSIALSETEVQAWLDPHLSVAAINSPTSCVVSGPETAIESLAARLTDQAVQFRRVPIEVAAHSAMVEPILEPFKDFVATLPLRAPQIPLISNVTGDWITVEEATDPHYWVRHLRQTVRFAQGVHVLQQDPKLIFLEAGPGQTLSHLVRRQLRAEADQIVLPSLRHSQDPRPDEACIIDALGKLWLAGVQIDWAAFYAHERRQRLPLPTYPFERQSYWIEPVKFHVSEQVFEAAPAATPVAPTNNGNGAAMATPEQVRPAHDAQAAPQPDGGRQIRILEQLKAAVSELTGLPVAEMEAEADFFQLGLDSLLLVQANHAIKDMFGVEVTLRQLYEELTTLKTLSAYIDEQLPPEPVAAPPEPVAAPPEPVATPAAPAAPVAAPGGDAAPQPLIPAAAAPVLNNTVPPAMTAGTALEQLMAQQLQLLSEQLHVQQAILSQQLDVLRGQAGTGAIGGAATPAALPPPAPAASRTLPRSDSSTNGKPAQPEQPGPQPFVAYKPLQTQAEKLTERQQQHLEQLIARYTARTQKSKERIQESRFVRVNHRNVLAFRLLWKEMVYPIIAPQSRGSRVWDLDGNEYIDLTMGFGVTFFGHSPEFITQAVEAELHNGFLIGPYAEKADQVAQLISELTGVERVAFYNSGTEAVMVALRVARAATGRAKVALFSGAYHGTFDGVLARANLAARDGSAVPLAPGIPAHMIEDVLVLNYGTPQALDIIREHAHELAAVLVEPVQSRRPDLQPREFLKDLRRLTTEIGAALIFDEIITGFRLHPGGAQAWFDVQADIVTYGKVVGGGLPIGIVAGKAAFMDSIDGGMWRYGDGSYPAGDERRTIVGGTFCEHPLTMSAAVAVLTYLKEQGPELQQGVNQRTAYLAETLNHYFEQTETPLRITYCASIFRFVSYGDAELLFYHLLDKGIYTWEGRSCFLSLAHTDEDVEYIIQSVKDSVAAMRKGGFLPDTTNSPDDGGSPPNPSGPPTSGPPPSRREAVPGTAGGARELPTTTATAVDATPIALPLTEEQRQLWFLTQVSDEAAAIYNDSAILSLRGTLNIAALRQTVQAWVDRHEALRTAITPEGDIQQIMPAITIEVPLLDCTAIALEERASYRDRWLRAEVRKPFRLDQPPFLRTYILKWNETEHDLVFIAHHIAVDGWSWSVLLQDFALLYPAACQGRSAEIAPPRQFRDYVAWQAEQSQRPEFAAAREYWQAQLSPPPPVLELATDHPRSAQQAYAGGRQQKHLDAELYQALRQFSRQHNATVFMTFLAAFQVFLHRLTGQPDFVVALPLAEQPLMGAMDIVGQCSNTIPFRSQLAGDPPFNEYLASLKQRMLQLFKYQSYSFATLSMPSADTPIQVPELTVMFNMDRNIVLPEIANLKGEILPGPAEFAKADLFLNIIDIGGALRLDFDYNASLFDHTTCRRWFQYFETLLRGIIAEPSAPLSRLPLVSAAEQEWQFTAQQSPQSVLPQLHQAFELQADRLNQQTCVVFGDGALSYGELNRRANQLARHLQALGLKPGAVASIYLEPSWQLAVALLAVLKTGGAYLLYDPSTAQAVTKPTSLWITRQTFGETRPDLDGPVVCMDHDWPAVTQLNADNLAVAIAPQHPACVIAAAEQGPDALCLSHAALQRHVAAIAQALQLDGTDRLAVWTSATTYPLVERLWAALIRGAQFIHRSSVAQPARAVYQALQDQTATVVDLPLHLWRQQASPATTELPDNLKRVVINGGIMLWADAQSSSPTDRTGPELLYAYQPEQVPITITARPIVIPADAVPFEKIQPGAPLVTDFVYLLDAYHQTTPVGVPGNLYLLADPLAAVPETTLDTSRWMHNPGGKTGWLYNTGERARYVASGGIEALGPQTHEVKLRSFTVRLNEVEAILHQHPAVREAAVRVNAAPSPDGQILPVIAYVAPHAHAQSLPETPSAEEHVRHWQSIFDETYSLALFGWNSHYTGQPFPEAEIQDIVARTVERILELKPRRALEIGTGSGMLLFKIAPHCTQYYGTDFSADGLQHIAQQIDAQQSALSHVVLLQKRADQLEEFEPATFDTVILNSVIQYFPGVDYLLQVLENAVKLVAPGGAIFLGEVRSLPLQPIFHTESEMYRADDTLSLAQLKQQIVLRAAHENELVIDPAFFTALPQYFPQISGVELQLKRGCCQNELTRFRYDVVLRLGEQQNVAPVVEWHEWASEDLTLDRLDALLRDATVEILGVRGMPNARLMQHVHTYRLLQQDQTINTAGELRAASQQRLSTTAVEPEALWAWSKELPYSVEIRWSGAHAVDRYDVVFRRRDTPSAQAWPVFPEDRTPRAPWHTYVNNPLQVMLPQTLVPQLRRFLQTALPDSHGPLFVVLDTLPRLAAGQIDEQSLPLPAQDHVEATDAEYVAPRDALEEAIAATWAEIFGLKQVSVEANFFELGGQSLIATQLLSRLRQTFKVELPLRILFEAPTIAGVAGIIRERQTARADGEHTTIQRQQRTSNTFAPSFAQQRLWYIEQLGADATYNLFSPVRITGPLNIAALQQSLDEIVRRHETLRTTFADVYGQPVQIIGPAKALPLPIIDLQELSEQDQEARLHDLATSDARQLFDLGQWPLFRVTLLRLSPTNHVLLVTMHHIISDGWSITVLLREITILYYAFLAGRPSPLPELPIQYADFAQWQRSWLQGPMYEQQLAYWKQQLGQSPGVLELPTDRPRPPFQTFNGATYRFEVPQELVQPLKRLSQQENATLFMTLLTAFKALLYLYSSQTDILVGTPVANRHRIETEDLIGFFVNMLVIRTDLSGHPSFRELLGRVREGVLAAYTHQDMPFEKLVEVLFSGQDRSRPPLFQVMFLLDNQTVDYADADLQLSLLPIDNGTAKFDVSLLMEDTGDRLHGALEYNTDLFESATMMRMAEHFVTFLSNVVTQPDEQL